MEILALGVDHQHSDVALRERLAVPSAELPELYARLAAHLPEAVVLSTCNRTELYALVDRRAGGREAAIHLLSRERAGLPIAELAGVLGERWQEDAVRHLFRVAVGLESLIVGEPEILGQIRGAADAARRAGSAGPVLTRLFRDALAVGRRARVESGIARSAVSVATAAVELAQKAVCSLDRRTVLVGGAGKMSAIAARSLAARRAGRILVTSRRLARAEELAARVGGEAYSFDRLAEAVAESDVVITATAAPGPVFSESLVRRALAGRPERPLVLVDVAVPRDVEPSVSGLPSCTVYNIDDLAAVRQANLAARRLEGAKVEAIVEREVDKFAAWRAGREVAPTIAELVARAEQIRRAELDRALARMGPVAERERNAVDAMTQAIVNKILHDPIVRLKQRGGHHDASVYVHAVRELFGLRAEVTGADVPGDEADDVARP